MVQIEDNGWACAGPEVLAALSKRGKAASVFWNVNGLVRFGCAGRGKVLASLELLEPDDALEDLPAALQRIWEVSGPTDAPVAVAMTMAQRFTGVAVPQVAEIAQPSTAYAIRFPVLGLLVTPQELLDTQYFSPGLVAAVQAASPHRRRALAEWATRHALEGASIEDLPQLRPVLESFGQGEPIRLTAEAGGYRQEARRMSEAAEEALSVEGDLDRYEQLRHWQARSWALEALAYTAERDDVTAALGATYCASIPHRLGSNEYDQFLNQATNRVNE